MIIYILLVIIILIGGIINSKVKKINYRLTYCTVIGIVMLLIIGLRNINLGILDTRGIYIPAFRNIINLDFQSVIELYNKDVIFYIITKLFTYICKNENIWLLFVSAPLIYAVTKTTYKYSKIPSLSFIAFLALNYYGMNFTLLRHSIALAFVLISYPYLIERKFIKFVICILIASCFHQTSLAFLIAYPLIEFKFTWKQLLILVAILIISIVAKSEVFNLIFLVLKGDRFQGYASRGETIDLMPFYINTAVLMFCYIYYRIKLKQNIKEIDKLLNLSWISSCFLTLTQIIGEAYRVAMFFGIFNILLLPEVLKIEKKMNDKYLIYLGIYGFLIFYFLIYSLDNAMIVPYRFFWQ